MVEIALAYSGFVRRWSNIKPTVDNYADDQNDVEPTSFVNVGQTILPTKSNVGTMKDCNLGRHP